MTRPKSKHYSDQAPLFAVGKTSGSRNRINFKNEGARTVFHCLTLWAIVNVQIEKNAAIFG